MKKYLCLVAFLVSACGISDALNDIKSDIEDGLEDLAENSGKFVVGVRASGLATSPSAAPRYVPLSVLAPDIASGEYDGMGVNSAQAVVDGLKIRLTGITISNQIPGQSGGDNLQNIQIFDWHDTPRELDIAAGFNAPLEETSNTAVAPATYTTASVSFQSNYDIKAYAYFDYNNDGTVDTTLWSTAAGIVTQAAVLGRAQLTDYDFYHYGFIYTFNADSVDNSTTESGTISVLDTPFEVTAGATSLSVNLLIDSFQLASAWDGRLGNSWGNFPFGVTVGAIPTPVAPFPNAPNPSISPNQYGLNILDFWPIGEPSFALQYMPAYAFVNVDGLDSQTYVISPVNQFDIIRNKTLGLVTRDGAPILGRITINNGDGGLHNVLRVGQIARLFSAESDGGYTFYTDYRMEDDAGNSDGGLYYNSDAAMAGHKVQGFRMLDNVGDTGTATLIDGPRCNGEYNYCLYGTGTTFYYKRVR